MYIGSGQDADFVGSASYSNPYAVKSSGDQTDIAITRAFGLVVA